MSVAHDLLHLSLSLVDSVTEGCEPLPDFGTLGDASSTVSAAAKRETCGWLDANRGPKRLGLLFADNVERLALSEIPTKCVQPDQQCWHLVGWLRTGGRFATFKLFCNLSICSQVGERPESLACQTDSHTVRRATNNMPWISNSRSYRLRICFALPGVQHLIDQGFIDERKIGVQGHSWGGYQTAYLVTQADMFACAGAGALVSNMTSAYDGIRWGSGKSRMFQYEIAQSRIGDDLWSAREKYIANSPLFFADKVNTPILLLHNDEDGSVPWSQGIEFFVALRRLEKPAWLLNYNGQSHKLMKPEIRLDYAIRMQQFFDHYLKDAPEPEWMACGIPAVDKGKKHGLELLEPAQPKESGPTPGKLAPAR